MRFVFTALIFALLPFAAPPLAFAQRTIPVDNEQVKVLSVIDPAGQPAGRLHEHKMNRVMIYLDAGEQHIVYKSGKVQELKFAPGQAIWSPASGLHTSQNISGLPYRIVEIELKGDPKPFSPPALDPVKVFPAGYKVELDNPQVRIVRVRFNPKQKVPLHEHALNRVVVFLKPQKLRVTPEGGDPTELSPAEGEVRFSMPGRHVEENLGDGVSEAIMVEIK